MADFEPRIEDPPEREVDPRKVTESKNQQLRDFVKAAAGKWCLVLEQPGTTKKSRTYAYARLWSAFMRLSGFVVSGFEVRSHTAGRVFKVYARFDESKVMRSPQ